MRYLIYILIPVLWVACGKESTSSDIGKESKRIVSLSGAITETLVEMGFRNEIVGIDVTSTYPSGLTDSVAQLGHVTNLNSEAVLALAPSVIMVAAADSSKSAVKTLKNSGIRVMYFPADDQLDNALIIARKIAEDLGDPFGKLHKIEQKFVQTKEELDRFLEENPNRPSVLFIYARGMGSLMVGGAETNANVMIEQAGAVNAAKSINGFKPLTPESLVALNPDVLLFFESGLQSLGGKDGIHKINGLMETTAGKKGQIIAMDGLYLLGFTPRAASAALELAQSLRDFPEDS